MSRAIVLLSVLTCTVAAGADVPEPNYSAMAVQNRKHVVDHEFTLSLGVLPLDAFTKGMTVSGAYTLHFDEQWAWEVAHFFWSFHVESDLRDELLAFDLKPTPFEVLDYFVTSNVVFTPIYWKGSALNQNLVYGEMMLLAGGGYARWTRSHRPVLDAGAALRFFVGSRFSLRLDVRYLLFVAADEGAVDHDVWIGLGASIGL